VSYPGIEMPANSSGAAPSSNSDGMGDDGRRLSPVRDTGLEIQTRTSRQQEGAARRQRRTLIATVVGVAVLITAAIAWRYVSDRMAATSPLTAETASASGPAGKAISTRTSASGSPEVARAAATPVFASYGRLKMHLPVPLSALTEIGFHQASYSYALRMKTPMKDADTAKAVKYKTTGRDLSKQAVGDNVPMTGTVIRMWRNRPGQPDTAADVGAAPGTKVLAPVDGTIVKIKSYKLYGKYPDYEVHIHPDGTSGLDLVMIHLTSLTCKVGDHVDGGITPIAKIRKFSDKFHDQLANYTRGGGDHVHINLNNSNYPGYKGLIGAISVPRSGTATSQGTGNSSRATTGAETDEADSSSSGD
jgi:murein DD-endopeptidase MepM/ murein hydrolase activator NlpD